ncbi:MAG TPA: ATP-binding cassette domain-containing protein, partial [Paenibacillus sp.]|nr:ATP-binding cassette domain-containing protein [Paenibacillus sp.]
NLLMGRTNVDDSMLREACHVAQIHAFVEGLPDGYDTFIGERGIQLSGGQRQRLALARALIDHPDILILDEATSALDLETERLVMQGIDEWRRGRTTIFIAHRLSTVQNADLIHVLRDGVVAESGTHEELLVRGGLYAALASKQNEAVS